jgi:hypothetical protein
MGIEVNICRTLGGVLPEMNTIVFVRVLQVVYPMCYQMSKFMDQNDLDQPFKGIHTTVLFSYDFPA